MLGAFSLPLFNRQRTILGWDFYSLVEKAQRSTVDARLQWLLQYFYSIFNIMESEASNHIVMTQHTNSCFSTSLQCLKYIFFNLVPSQIGSNIFLTAAHCLLNWAGEVFLPSELKIFLGVQNKRQLNSRARFRY